MMEYCFELHNIIAKGKDNETLTENSRLVYQLNMLVFVLFRLWTFLGYDELSNEKDLCRTIQFTLTKNREVTKAVAEQWTSRRIWDEKLKIVENPPLINF